MWWLLGKLHTLAFKLALLVGGVLFRLIVVPIGAFLRVGWAWAGEEFQRWSSLAVFGAMLFMAGKAVMNYAPSPIGKPLAIVLLVLMLGWSLVVMGAARLTLRNSFRLVRQRLGFQKLSRDVAGVREDVSGIRDRAAKAAWGTPAQPVFRENRKRAGREAAEEAAERRRHAAEQERLDDLAALEPDPYESQPS